MSYRPRNTILTGDALTILRKLPDAYVDCVVTSPPYFQLRNYGIPGQLGLEPTVDEWVAQLRKVLAEIARVLKPSGALWIVVGDSFSRHPRYLAPTKSLLLAPERLGLALIEDGWIIRNKVVWAKSNPMPSSITDRLTLTYEVIYFAVRQPRYWFDLDAIRESPRSDWAEQRQRRQPTDLRRDWAGPLAGTVKGLRQPRPTDAPEHPLKNPGDLWMHPISGFRGAHFATFPPGLIRRPIVATCPEAICTHCGQPWPRRVGKLVPCACGAPTRPGLVLDPFLGAGTSALVARELHREWLGIEINPAYVELARTRLCLTTARPPGAPEERAA
jgi:site-specific DNA-methyltransferase (adenine-specific)